MEKLFALNLKKAAIDYWRNDDDDDDDDDVLQQAITIGRVRWERFVNSIYLPEHEKSKQTKRETIC